GDLVENVEVRYESVVGTNLIGKELVKLPKARQRCGTVEGVGSHLGRTIYERPAYEVPRRFNVLGVLWNSHIPALYEIATHLLYGAVKRGNGRHAILHLFSKSIERFVTPETRDEECALTIDEGIVRGGRTRFTVPKRPDLL